VFSAPGNMKFNIGVGIDKIQFTLDDLTSSSSNNITHLKAYLPLLKNRFRW